MQPKDPTDPNGATVYEHMLTNDALIVELPTGHLCTFATAEKLRGRGMAFLRAMQDFPDLLKLIRYNPIQEDISDEPGMTTPRMQYKYALAVDLTTGAVAQTFPLSYIPQDEPTAQKETPVDVHTFLRYVWPDIELAFDDNHPIMGKRGSLSYLKHGRTLSRRWDDDINSMQHPGAMLTVTREEFINFSRS